ncbi:hypothetical protein QZH41_013114 [Actinostola sp. cb2023]|nr:hypothetical protein QZH41_013114 [Actinostola sp. cb2023]
MLSHNSLTPDTISTSLSSSPAKKEEPTLSNKLAKAVAASNAIIIVPDTPTSEKKNVKTKPQKTPSPSKPAKESPKKKPVTPQAVHEEDAPASLEKKKSSYRNFMQREGPKALGSKEIPQANTLGTKIIDEDGFFNLIKTTPGKKSAYEQTPEKPPAKKPKTSVKESPLAKPSTPKPSKDAHLSIQASTSMVESQNSQKSTSSLASPATQTPSGSPVVKEESLMWVDKYKPQNIKQIIGQQGDKSNMRKLMNWVNNWNKNRRKTHPKTSFFQKDQDGAIHKAALLSGPPGVGKTTTAVLVCREMGYSYVEMNASDSRNKKCLEQHVSQLLSNKTMDAFVGGSESVCQDASKHILIMDEVDGMAGNEDRGGMQELISLIKGSKIPIICMCNDRNSQKIRSLVNYCFDLRFQRPRVEQIKGAMLSIAFKEGLKIPPPAMDQIILGANQDIRQVLHNMSMWSSTNKKMTYDQAKDDASKAHKDIKMGPFDAIRKLLSFESFKLSLIDKSDLFFCDYSLMPLFVQENYLSVRPSKAEGNIIKCLELVSKSADSISDGDLVEKQIRSRASWSLLPTQAIFSSVIPSYFIGGGMDQRIDFPQWLGKNSKRGRLDRILQELQCHMRLRTSADKACINLDYIPHLRNSLTLPLMDEVNAKEGVTGIIQLLQAYDLTREDWDSIMEAGQYQGHRDPMTRIPSKVKAAFTRAYNKDHHKTPYALKSALSKSRGKSHDMESSQGDGNEEEHDEEEEESLENSAMLVKNKKPASRAKGSKEQQSKGKGKGKGPKT